MNFAGPNILPSDVSNALVIFLFCFLVVWAYRIILKGCLITDLSLSIDHHAVYRVEGYTDEQMQMEGGYIPRAHFEKLLRNRRLHLFPPMTVEKVKNPVHLLKSSLSLVNTDQEMKKEKKEFESFGVSFEFNCSVPCLLTLHWGVTIDSLRDIASFPTFTENDTVPMEGEDQNDIEMTPLSSMKKHFPSTFAISTLLSLPSQRTYTASFSPGTHKFSSDFESSFPSNEFNSLPPSFSKHSSLFPLVIVLSSNDNSVTKYSEVLLAHFPRKGQTESTEKEGSSENAEENAVGESLPVASSSSSTFSSSNVEDFDSNVFGQYLVIERIDGSLLYEVKDIYADDHSEDCVVCLTHERDTTLLPCRHFCVCGHCMEMLTKCPICRTPLTSFLKWKDESTQPAITGEEHILIDKKEQESVIVEMEEVSEKRS